MKPLCIDLCAGLGGWSEGFLAEGYESHGYDIEAHDYGKGGYPGTLFLRDILTIHGSEFKDAAVIVASPPCQRYSYMAMPWSRAKAQAAAIRADKTGEELRKLNELFDACFRIQREASEAAGHHIPMVVENVRGAQPWVGTAKWNYGSFYLWGDVPALMPMTFKALKNETEGSWFPQGNGSSVTGNHGRDRLTEAMGRKVSVNFHEHEKTGKPGRSFQSAAVEDTFGWRGSIMREGTSHGKKRKAASAMIAKIPYPLALHVARTYKPKQ